MRVEHYETNFMRVKTMQNFLQHFFALPENRRALEGGSEEEKRRNKVGIVSHGMFLRCFSSSGFDPEKKLMVGAKYLNNCQIVPSLNYKI
mmetsp:Transcript_16601/g.28270  ORF Transcript_16601/g.28270 Transcript_16601/m.28270 type:complete len:90 (+) Transcript_16601:710-979(+)